MTSEEKLGYTAPGLDKDVASEIIVLLGDRMVSLIDLTLTLKHIHWNVTGSHFLGVHEMLDSQHTGVQGMVDVLAERIATLGGSPRGTPGHVVESRSWDDYSIGRDTTGAHLGALDLVYDGVISDHRAAQEKSADLDPVTEDIFISQIADLEHYHWFVRAQIEDPEGHLSTEGATTLKEAATAE